jgi:hypothetical protein
LLAGSQTSPDDRNYKVGYALFKSRYLPSNSGSARRSRT